MTQGLGQGRVAGSGFKEIGPHGDQHREVFRLPDLQQAFDVASNLLAISIQGEQLLELIHDQQETARTVLPADLLDNTAQGQRTGMQFFPQLIVLFQALKRVVIEKRYQSG